MQKRYAIRNIAIGIILTDGERRDRVARINDEINEMYSSIRSSSDNDGLPHGTTVGNPVASLAVQAERLGRVRDIEQERINAVEWARQCVRDTYSNGDEVIKAVLMFLSNRKDEALNLIEDIGMPFGTFTSVRSSFINNVLKYLYLK